jgi:hypothetical protein
MVTANFSICSVSEATMNKKLVGLPILLTWLALLSCALPTSILGPAAAPTAQVIVVTATSAPGAPVPTPIVTVEVANPQLLVTLTTAAGFLTATAQSPTATSAPAPVATSAPAPLAPTACVPTAVANQNANVRSGPGTAYPSIGAIPKGGSATVIGRNAVAGWWYIEYPSAGRFGWIAGSVVDTNCLPAVITEIPAPPLPTATHTPVPTPTYTPVPVSGTCKPGFIWRLINGADKVCVPPASKAQAVADNAAAASRRVPVGTCIVGYVWREAFSGDKVCVLPAVRSQAAADNAAAASRWTPGPYGPHTCIAGFVWREARVGDDVCVTGAVRSQAAADNAAAASRKVDPATCLAGFVWREAFAGDLVCVTPAIRSQTAADNAAAPGRTWP